MDASHLSPKPAQSQLRFPLWQYLNQEIGHPAIPLVLNPRRFWVLQQVEHLDRCWQRACTHKENS
jgi:hypothetical protein